MSTDVLIRLRGDVTDVVAKLGIAKANVASFASSATKQVGEFNRALAQSAEKREALNKLGTSFGLIGAAAAVGIGAAVRSAANFEQAISHVQAATHETAGNMALLRQAALDFGQSTQYSATEAAGAIEELSKAGVSTADILHGGLEGALNLAAAGGIAVADAASDAASAMTQFGLSGAAVPHVADLLAAGAGKAQGSVADLGMALNQVGLVANQTGLSIEETTGGLAAFASAGLTGSDAGTSFKTMLQSLTPRSQQAAKLMEELNLSAYDAQGNFIGLTAYAGKLQDALKGMSEEQQAAALKTIFGSDAVRAASVLYKDGADGIQAWIDKTNDSGYAAETAALRMDNLKGDLEQLKGALETAFIGTGDSGLAPLREMTQVVTSLVNAYNDLPAPVKNTALALGGLTAVVGLSAFAAARAVTAYAAFNANLATLGIRSTTAAGGMGALNKRALVASAGIAAVVTGAVVLAGANNDLVASIDTLNDSLGDTSGFDAQNSSLTDLAGRIADMRKDQTDFSWGTFSPQNLKNYFTPPWMDNDLEKAQAAFAQAKAAQDSYKQSLSDLTNTVQGNTVWTDFTGDLKTLQATADDARPALEGMGLDLDKILQMRASDSGFARLLGEVEFRVAAEAVKDYNAAQDSVPGRTRSVAAAVADMGDNMKSAAQKATGLQNALDRLLGPELGLSEATDEWTTAIRHLDDDLAKHNKAITGTTDAAIKNRAAIRDRVTAMTDVLVAEAKAGATSGQLSAKLREQRKALLDAGAAAGISRQDLNEYLDTLGLTPKLVRTLIKADTTAATSAIDRVLADLNNLDGKTVHTYVTTTTDHVVSTSPSPAGKHALGGQVHGNGRPTADDVPIWASSREWVMPVDSVDKYGAAFMSAVQHGRYAAGGQVGHANGGQVGQPTTFDDLLRLLIRGDIPATLHSVAMALHDMRAEARDVTHAERDLKAAREAAKNATHQVNKTTRDVSKAEKDLSKARGAEHKDLAEIHRLEDNLHRQREKLKDQTKAQTQADKDQAQAEKELSKQKSQLTDAEQALKAERDQLIQQAQEVRDAILATGAAFGGSGTSNTAQGFLAKLTGSVSQAQRFDKDIDVLRRRNLDQGVIDQILAAGSTDGLELAESLAHAPRSLIAQINREQHQLDALAARVGSKSVRERDHNRGSGGRREDSIARGEGGYNHNVNFYGPVSSNDVDRLADQIAKRDRQALRVMRRG